MEITETKTFPATSRYTYFVADFLCIINASSFKYDNGKVAG